MLCVNIILMKADLIKVGIVGVAFTIFQRRR